MGIGRALALLPGVGGLLLLAFLARRSRRARRQGRDWYLQPNQVKAVGDLLPTVSGVMMGFTASIIIYSLNIESESENTVLIRFNIRNTAVVFELVTFALIFASMVLALYIKSRSPYDIGFPSHHRFEEAEFAREESRRTLEFLASLTLVTYAVAISCLLMGLTVAASPYLNDVIIEVIDWFPLFAVVAVLPLALRLFAFPLAVDGLAADVRVDPARSEGPLEGRIALWRAHPAHAREEWAGVLALFSDTDYATLRTSYLRHEPLRIAFTSAVTRHGCDLPRAAATETRGTDPGTLSAFVEAMDLPGRPLRAKLAGIGSFPDIAGKTEAPRDIAWIEG